MRASLALVQGMILTLSNWSIPMHELKSNHGSDIEITLQDELHPERVTVSADGYSYTVFASRGCFTHGEQSSAPLLARPNKDSDGAIFRFAVVNDKQLAHDYGFSGSWAYFLRLLSVKEGSSLEPDTYHELGTAGWTTPVDTQQPCDAAFYTVWYDANSLGETRLPPGDVFVKGLVETTKADLDPNAEQFIFCGNELAEKGVIAVMVDRVWARTGEVVQESFNSRMLASVGLPDYSGKGHKLNADHAEIVLPNEPEMIDGFRLLYSASERQECYVELLEAARELTKKKVVPDYVVQRFKDEAEASIKLVVGG